MATDIIGMNPTFADFYNVTSGTSLQNVSLQESFVIIEPLAGGVSVEYENRVLDSVVGDFVEWRTFYQDIGGNEYPGPGVFGVDTSDYVVQSIITTRNQV